MMIDDVEVTVRNARVPCVKCRASYYIPSRVQSGKLLYRCIGCGSRTSRREHHQRKAAILRAVRGDDVYEGVDFFVCMPDESVVAVSIHFDGANAEPEQVTPLIDLYAGLISEAEIRAIVHSMAATPEIGDAMLAELYASVDG